MNLRSVIESILFVAGRPVKLSELQKATGASQDELVATLAQLQGAYQNSGILILEQNQSFLMSTNPENTSQTKAFLNIDLREKLTEAAIETLAIVAYKQPVSRAEIESIRGVNSQYTLRLLRIRGLVERSSHPTDSRIGLYRTTHEFLQHLGLKNSKDLPDFEELTAKVKPPEGFVTTPGQPSS